MVERKLLRKVLVNESLVEQPLDGSALRSNTAKAVPRRDQFGMVFIEFVLESSKGAAPLQGPFQASTDRSVADTFCEVGHVPKPHVGWKRIDGNEIQFVNFDGVLPVDSRVAGPERHLTGSWVDEPSVLVVGLIRKRGGDLLYVDSGQVEHAPHDRTSSAILEEASCRRPRQSTNTRRNDATTVRFSVSLGH